MLRRLFEILILSLWILDISQAEVFEECGDGKVPYVASSKGCSYYISCDGENSEIGQCEEDAPYFSQIDQACDIDQSVCKVETGEPAAPPSTTLIVAGNPTTLVTPEQPSSTTNTLVPTTSSMTSSSSAVPTSSTTTSTIDISGSSTTPASIPSSTAVPQCPAVDDPLNIVFLADATSCSDYFMCYHGEPVLMHCSNMLHFDPKTKRCEYPENVKCQLDTASPHEKCQIHTNDVYPHPSNCNYFYVCRFGYLMIMQCPLNMNWDYEKKACALKDRAQCYHISQNASIKFLI